jgi:hypothetical protein
MVAVVVYRGWSRNREVDGPVQEADEFDEPLDSRMDE